AVAYEGLRADVLQADGIEHAGGGLAQPRARIARHGDAREALGDDAAQAAEIDDVLELGAVAERAACGQHGVFQTHTGDVNAQVHGWGAETPGSIINGSYF